MSDSPLVSEIVRQLQGAADTILRRFEPIERVDDLTSSDAGLEKLDALCMQLIAIGESLKNLDKVTDGTMLPRYPQIEWK